MKKLILRLGQMLCFLSFILMLFHYSLILKYAKEGLSVWASCVLPLLLPFILLSKFWIRYKIPELLFNQMQKIFSKKTVISISLPIFLLGLCTGFPIGAILISHYYQTGILNRKHAESLLPLASFVSPMFVMGYVHSQINLSGTSWLYYLLCLYLPVLLCYLFIHCFIMNKQEKKVYTKISILSKKEPVKSIVYALNKPSDTPTLTEEVFLPSLEVIFIIGIYMMIFSILSGMLTSLPLFQTPALTFLLANLEVTTGIHLLATRQICTLTLQHALIAATTSFGGMCTMAQVQTVISSSDLSLKKYVLIKTLTALLSFLLCIFLLH